MNIIQIRNLIVFSLIIVSTLSLGCGGDKSTGPTKNNLIFEKTYASEFVSSGTDVIMTSDGSYVMTGYKKLGTTNGTREVYLLKVDKNGVVQWEKTYGGVGIEYGSALLELPNGGYIIGGSSGSFGNGQDDFYLIKADSIGNLIWEKTYDLGSNDYCTSICLTSEGGYLLVGSDTNSDLQILKLDSNGIIIRDRTYPKMIGYSVIAIPGNNFLIAGVKITIVNGVVGREAFIMKINTSGLGLWTKLYGVEQSVAKSISPTANGGYIVAGYTKVSSANIRDMYLIRIDSNGDSQWIRNYGGNSIDVCNSVKQTADGGFILAGSSDSFGAGNLEAYLVKVDQSGSLQWEKTFGGSSGGIGNAVILSAEDGYVITGIKGSDLYLIVTDANGNVN